MYFLSQRRILTGLLAAALSIAMLWPVNVSVPSGTDKLVHLASFGLLVLLAPGAPRAAVRRAIHRARDFWWGY